MSIRYKTAKRQFEQSIKDHGEASLTVTQVASGGTYNPATGLVEGGSGDSQTVQGYIGQRNSDGRADAAVSNSRNVMLMAQKTDGLDLTFRPSIKDTVGDGTTTVTLTAVREFRTAGYLVGYVCEGLI